MWRYSAAMGALRKIGVGGVVAVFLCAAWTPGVARAQQAGAIAPPQYWAPLQPPTFDAQAFNVPEAGRNSAVNFNKFRKEIPNVSVSDRVDLGGSMLRFDTSRSVAEGFTRAEAEPPGLLNKKKPAQNYFGLTLIAPHQ
ncbi:MAG: hypothetical protein ABI830_01075 [Pseudolabrys sp.]